jgi:hypothetical protein
MPIRPGPAPDELARQEPEAPTGPDVAKRSHECTMPGGGIGAAAWWRFPRYDSRDAGCCAVGTRRE